MYDYGIMAFEIELKARLNDFAPIKERLFALGSYLRSYKKSDSYWISAPTAPAVRVRRESGLDANGQTAETVLVTCKIKEISGGIEVNDEKEFTVSNGGLFEDLLSRLGLRLDIRKEKEGWAWLVEAGQPVATQPAILAELSLVTGLGWFLELEILAGSNNGQIVAESQKRLLALLEKLEIPAESIEARPYTEMLRELREAN